MKGRMKVRAGDAVRCHVKVMAREGVRAVPRSYLFTFRSFTEAARTLTASMAKHPGLKWTRTVVITKRRGAMIPKKESPKAQIKQRVKNSRARKKARHPEALSNA